MKIFLSVWDGTRGFHISLGDLEEKLRIGPMCQSEEALPEMGEG